MGHTVIQVPVPALEAVVRPHVLASRPGVKLPDGDVVCAHITLLGPFVDRADDTPELRDQIRDVLGDVHRFEFSLTDFRGFADGLVYLAPEPAEPFNELTEKLSRTFPQWPPYGGQFDELIPHLSIGTSLPAFEIMALLQKLPVEEVADEVTLTWWGDDEIVNLETFALVAS